MPALRIQLQYAQDAGGNLGGAAENREEKLSGFARELFTGACGRLPEIDAILAASAENWRLHRIARVPLAVLRLAVYELLTAGAENERIIINEALEICRTYADEKAVAFVNGVLGKAADAVGSTRELNAPERQALTVTELNTLAKEYLENLPLFRSVSVKGELSNVTLHRTGHIYFSIKRRGARPSPP